MRPNPDRVLMVMAGALGALTPEVRTPFGMQTANLSGALAAVLAQEWDRAAARLVEENVAVTALLQLALPMMADEILRARIDGVTARIPAADLRISALQAENDDLRRILIEVQKAVENIPGEQAESLNQRIWGELRESTRRRRLVTGG